MSFLIESLTSLIIKMFAGAADLLGNGILGLLCIDIGSGRSFFDIVFGAFGNFFGILKVMAMCILAINFVWQIVRTMVTPEGAGETVFSLVGRTLAAGILIASGTVVVGAFEELFNAFYTYILQVEINGATMPAAVNFTEMTSSFGDAVTAGAGEEAMSAGGLILILLMTLLIIYQFVFFMLEVAERYVVLGVLYYTSPLAFSMLGSKSTSQVFASWVRMVGCQMFLMICNVLFFRLFLEAFSHYNEALTLAKTTFNESVDLPIAIVWCLVLSSILNVGQKVDSYLGTLGLSAAQTGRGLGASLVAAGLGVSRIMRGAGRLGSAVAHSKAGQKAGEVIGNGAKTAGDKINKTLGIGGEKVARDGSTGAISRNSILNKVNDKASPKEHDAYQGHAAEMGFSAAASGSIPESALQKIDGNSFRMGDDGSVSMRWNAGKANEAQITAVPIEGPNASSIDTTKTVGRVFSLTGEDGQSTKMFATAEGAGANEFLAYNPAMNSKMAEVASTPGMTAQEVAPGVWQTTRTDANGNITEAKQYASANLYGADAALGSHVESVGGMDYHVSDITSAANGVTRMERPITSGVSQTDAVASIQTQFQSMSGYTPTNVTPDVMGSGSGVFTFQDQASGATWAVAPAAEYGVHEAASGTSQTIYASNGAAYTATQVQSPQDASVAFYKREGVSLGQTGAPADKSVYAQPLHTASDPRSFNKANQPRIFAEATRRSGEGKGGSRGGRKNK